MLYKDDMLRRYRFEHPKTEAMEFVTLTSYIAAAFFGPLYILYRKSSGFWPSLLLMIVLTAGIVGFSGLSSFYLGGRLQLIALPIVAFAALAIQSSFVMQQVRRHFRRRGWLVRAF